MIDRRSLPIVLLILAGGACSTSPLSVPSAVDAATAPDMPAIVAEVGDRADTGPGDDAPLADVQGDNPDGIGAGLLPGNGGGDSPGSNKVAQYQKFLDDQDEALFALQANCLGWPRDGRRREKDTSMRPNSTDQIEPGAPELAYYFDLGLLDFDEEAAAACVRDLAAVSCQRMIEEFALKSDFVGIVAPTCSAVLVGKVPLGGACTDVDVCAPSLECGGNGKIPMCATCVPPPAPSKLGESCDDGETCAAGTDCHAPVGELKRFCLLPPDNIKQGMPCSNLQGPPCARGLFCASKAPLPLKGSWDGVCRPLETGNHCTNPAECAQAFYKCVGATSTQGGICQVGKGENESCSIIDYEQDQQTYRFSDCADGFICLDLDGQGRKCATDSPLGGACGVVDLQSGLSCSEGYCDGWHDNVPGICRPLKALGSPCERVEECALGLFCVPPSRGQPGVCAPAPKLIPAIGEHCVKPDGSYWGCGFGNYCAPPPGVPGTFFSPAKGFCAPLKKMGESCRAALDRCEPLSACYQGVSTRC